MVDTINIIKLGGMNLEKFANLQEDKQAAIIGAGLIAFGTNGYKKASIADIATAAGIAKSMIFHYFGTKKALYLYLAQYSAELLIGEINAKREHCGSDFFDRITFMTEIEVDVMKRYPGILAFLKSLFLEKDPEVIDDVKSLMAMGEAFRAGLTLDGIEAHKFKDGVDPMLVLKMLAWFGEGYISQLGMSGMLNVDVLNQEFHQILAMLKQNLYKEAYL